MNKGPRVLVWDIERRPNIAAVWNRWNTNVPMSMVLEQARTISFSALWLDADFSQIMHYNEFVHGRKKMLRTLRSLLDKADYTMSWNGRGFDSKHARTELLIDKIPPPSNWQEIDLWLQVKDRFKFESTKLDDVAKTLGVGEKLPHIGWELWLRCMAGDPKAWVELEKYNNQDVFLLVALRNRLLPWLTKLPNLNLYSDAGGCARCGGSLIRKGFRPTAQGKYQRYQCRECKGYTTETRATQRTNLRAE